jgi:putative transposase
MSYWDFYYHVVWSTKNRESWLNAETREMVRLTIGAHSRETRSLVHAIGFMPNHIHLVVSIPPRWSVADWIGHVKGASSKRVNNHARANGLMEWFAWQPEYGAKTFDEHLLPTVMAYAENQVKHHADHTLIEKYEIDERPFVKLIPPQ